MRIRARALARPRFGDHRIHTMRRRERWRVHTKRVRRLSRLEGLQARMRVRRRTHGAWHRGPAPGPTGHHQRWSMDVVHAQRFAGRPCCVLPIVDSWSRESPVLEVGLSLRGRRVVAVMERLRPVTGLPASLTVDHGTAFMSKALDAWAYYRGGQRDFTRPGKPTEYRHIESCNGRLRDECLTVHPFLSLADAPATIEAGRRAYNDVRPHSSLGDLPPQSS
jgi:putative transposase